MSIPNLSGSSYVQAGRNLAVLVVVAMAAAAFGAPLARGVQFPAAHERAVFTEIDLATGAELSRHDLGAGRSIGPAVVASGVLVAERDRCLSDDAPYRHGAKRVEGIDPRSGARRWMRSDVELATLPPSMLQEPAPRVVLLRDARRALHDGPVLAVNARNGRVLWSRPERRMLVLAASPHLLAVRDDPPLNPSPATQPSTVVRMLNRDTGAVIWKQQIDGYVDHAAFGDGFLAVFPAKELVDGRVQTVEVEVFAAGDGRPLQTIATQPSSHIYSTAAGSTVVAFLFPDVAIGYDVGTGAQIWQQGAVNFPSAVGDQIVSWPRSGPYVVSVLDAATGAPDWPYTFDRLPSTAWANKSEIVFSTIERFNAFDLASGTARWQRPIPTLTRGTYGPDDVAPNGFTAISARTLVHARGCATTSAD